MANGEMGVATKSGRGLKIFLQVLIADSVPTYTFLSQRLATMYK